MMKRYVMIAVLMASCSAGAGVMVVEDSGFESSSPVKTGFYEDENPWQEVKHRKKKPNAKKKKTMKDVPFDANRNPSLDRGSRLGPPLPPPQIIQNPADSVPRGEVRLGEDSAGGPAPIAIENNIVIYEPKVDLGRDWLIPLKMRRHISGTIMRFLNEVYEGPFPVESQEEIKEQIEYVREIQKGVDLKIQRIVYTLFKIKDACPQQHKLSQEWQRAILCYKELEILAGFMNTKIETPHLQVQYGVVMREWEERLREGGFPPLRE